MKGFDCVKVDGVVVCDIDGTVTGNDTVFDFFAKFGKLGRASELDAREASSDIEKVLEEMVSEREIRVEEMVSVADSAVFFNGAREFFSKVVRAGFLPVFASATYQPIAERVVARLGLPGAMVIATRVAVKNGRVKGFLGSLMEGNGKAVAVRGLSRQLRLPLSRFVGIGDGALDAPFIGLIVRSGGLGVAVSENGVLFGRARPQVRLPKPDFKKIWNAVQNFRRGLA